MADVYKKAKTGQDIIQGAAHVFVNQLSGTSKINPEDLDDEAASGIINQQSGVLNTRFDDITYYTT